MKRSTKLALSLVLAAAVAVPAFAQDNFPDTPANHWAYEALARMKKEGLLVGYPDGLFRGPRPASRYELAVAMHAVFLNLQGKIEGLQSQIDAIKGVDYKADIQALKDAVANLQQQIDAMKGWGDDIAALKKATETFDRELRSLGVDVEAMKKDIGDLADRVTRLEKRKPTVDISGDVNFLLEMDNSKDRPGLTVDGRLEGNDGGANVGLTRNVAIFHEGAFTFAGTNETGPKWKGTVVIGNMLGNNGFGSQSTLSAGVPNSWGFLEGSDDIYVQDLGVKFDTSIGGLAFKADVGRVGYDEGAYMMKRVDPFSYYDNERWSDGQYHFDGAILGFNFGAVKLNVFGGRNSDRFSTNGVDLNPMDISNNRFAGSFVPTNGIDRSLGADASFSLGSNGHVKLAYMILESNTDALLGTTANRDNVFGGDAHFNFGRIMVSGGYHKSNLTNNNSNVNDSTNSAWNAHVGYGTDTWHLGGGYRVVENDYFAPGDWGRLGILRDPSNIKGWNVGGWIDLGKALRISASGEFDKGDADTANTSTLTASPFNTSTNINAYKVKVAYKVNPNLSLWGSYEDTRFSNLVAGIAPGTGDSTYKWTTFGIGYGLSANAKLTISYQLSDVSNDFVLGTRTNAPADGRYTGGILTSQLSIKF